MSGTITTFDGLLAQAKILAGQAGPVRAVLIGADDPIHLKSIVRAAEEGIIDPILIGSKNTINKIAEKAGLDISGLELITCDSHVGSVAEAVKLIADDRVDLLVRGRISIGRPGFAGIIT
jgi:phosphate acetyltransferase